ncbi:MAG: MoaD/ThiS family protein [Hyphomicrobiaceae bacterium]
MKITMKLYASLGQHLPANAERNEAIIDVADGTSILSILDAHNVPRESCHLVLLNGIYQAPFERGEARLKDGDHLAVWPPVAGG